MNIDSKFVRNSLLALCILGAVGVTYVISKSIWYAIGLSDGASLVYATEAMSRANLVAIALSEVDESAVDFISQMEDFVDYDICDYYHYLDNAPPQRNDLWGAAQKLDGLAQPVTSGAALYFYESKSLEEIRENPCLLRLLNEVPRYRLELE